LVLSTQDFDIIQDLRELNGRPGSPLFDLFWSELKTLLESHACVDDRCHGECTLYLSIIYLLYIYHTFLALNTSFYICIAGNVCFLPVAISVRNLREQVVLRLRQQHPSRLEAAGIKIPSESWILYQFSPKHPSYAASLHYTVKANMKNKGQLRTLRAHLVDSHYCATLKKYVKHMGVRATTIIESHTPDDEEPACVAFYSLDDKAKVCWLYVRYPSFTVYSNNALGHVDFL
jgi:hypothetical protein